MNNYDLFIIMSIVAIYHIGIAKGNCSIFLSSVQDGGEETEVDLKCLFDEHCLPTSQRDGIYLQKKISDTWENLFSYNGSSQPIYRGDVHDLTGRSQGSLGVTNDEYTMTITNASVCDSGTWRCYMFKNSVGYPSTERTFSITVDTKPEHIQIKPENNVPLFAGETHLFTCSVNKISPTGSMMWTFNNTPVSGDQEDISDLDCGWSIVNRINRNFDIIGDASVKCELNQNAEKTSSVSTFPIKAPSKLEENISLVPNNPAANESFTLSCTASGSDVDITWSKDGTTLDKESVYFVKPAVTYVKRENLDYGQSHVTVSTLTSKPINPATADSIREQSGKFKCEAKVLSEAVRDEMEIELGSPPLANDGPVSTFKIKKGPLTLECNVTAHPTPNYIWQKNDDKLLYETRTVKTDVTEDCNFTCTATNIMGFAELYFIVRVEDPSGLSGGAIAGICISVIALIAGILAVLAFLYKKKQQKKDEEVAAYAESGNTEGASHGVNATKRVNTATTPPVYAEVDKNRKKQNKEEPAGAVYSQVNKQGRPLPNIKSKPGSTSTGPVYSEVNKPKQGRLAPIENQHYDNAGQRNEHGGLHYADVDFLRQGNGTKQSHSTKNPAFEPTEYAQIDHRKSAGIVV